MLKSSTCNQPSTGSEKKPKLKDRGYDNVLRDQDYHTIHGVVIDEYGEMME
jgi:hypothetical protein